MHPRPTRSGATIAVALLACCAAASAPAQDVPLLPIGVLGESGFHHAGTLSELVVLSDGKRVVSSARDGSARLWDLESGRELQRYTRSESDDIWGLLVLPGEKELLTAAEGGYVTRWDLATGKQLKTYRHGGTAFRVAMRPGRNQFVGTDSQNLAILWDLETGERVRTFKGHTESVYSATFAGGEPRLWTGGDDGALKVWDVESAECLKTFKNLDDVYTVSSSPDGSRVAACCGDHHLRIYDAETMKLLWEKELDRDLAVASWSPDGKNVATACEDDKLYIFDAKDGGVLRTIDVPGDYHTPIAYTPDGSELVSGGDRILYRYRVRDGERLFPTAGAPILREGVRALTISGNGDRVYAAGEGGEVHGWEVNGGRLLGNHRVDGTVKCLAVSPRGDRLAVGASNGAVTTVDPGTWKSLRRQEFEGAIDSVVFLREGRSLAAGGTEKKAWIWKTASGELEHTLEGHTNHINDMVVANGGHALFTVSDDKSLRIWDLITGKPVMKFELGEKQLHTVAGLADGRSFVAAQNDEEIWGWLAPPMEKVAVRGRKEVDELVRELGHEQFKRRDQATMTLVAMGEDVLPMLEGVRADDPEIRYRLRRIRADIRNGRFGGEPEMLHRFKEDMTGFAADPAGRYWAATMGYGVHARIVFGEVRDRKLKVLGERCDGHSPNHLAFTADGKVLAAGNRDGTISLFRVGE